MSNTTFPIALVLLLGGCTSLPFVTENEVTFGPFHSTTHKNIELKDLEVTYTDPETKVVTKVKAGSYTATADPNAASVALEEAKLRTAMVQAEQAKLIELIKELASRQTSTK